MRYALFDDWRLGVVSGDTITDITVESDWDSSDPQRSLVRTLRSAPVRPGPGARRLALSDVSLRPPVPRPTNLVAAPLNYRAHNTEMGQAKDIWSEGFFLKSPTSIIGPSEEILAPFGDRAIHHEAELGIVIGRETDRVHQESAMDHVAGFVCLLDITMRGTEERGWRKSFRTFTPIGPYLVTADEVPDPNALSIRCEVNGVERQRASTGEMICDVATLVAYVSSVFPLVPGDLIASGTPAGVGPLEPGDLVSVEIDHIGRLDMRTGTGTQDTHQNWPYSVARRTTQKLA